MFSHTAALEPGDHGNVEVQCQHYNSVRVFVCRTARKDCQGVFNDDGHAFLAIIYHTFLVLVVTHS